MRKVVLNMKENYKYSTIKSCSLSRLSKQGAATRLNISVRHVNRLLLLYKLHGKDGFIHGNIKAPMSLLPLFALYFINIIYFLLEPGNVL